MNLPPLLKNISEKMWTDLSENILTHHHELGTNREEIIREFLRGQLPSRYGVSTGFVFDSSNRESKQIDVIIYDSLETPVFKLSGGKKIFPCEGVLCVGEIKSVLESKSRVEEAFQNLLSVKELDRSSGGRNVQKFDRKTSIDQENNHLDQILSFLFVIGDCLQPDTMQAALISHIKDRPRHEWPNIIFAFDRYMMTYTCEYGHCPNPMHAWGVSVIDSASRSDLLIHFLLKIAQAVTATNIATFSYWDYLKGDTLPVAISTPFDQ